MPLPVMSDARHPLIQLAAEAIQAFVMEQRTLTPPDTLAEVFPQANAPAGAFVSLKTAGKLRGCIGTTEPACSTLAEEVIRNAIKAATRDPRFSPIQSIELAGLVISVDVLNTPEPIQDLSKLDHLKFGIIVRSGDRQGVLLPNIDNIHSVTEQLAIAREKARLTPHEEATIFRFTVTHFQ